jgi:hypothetical protein
MKYRVKAPDQICQHRDQQMRWQYLIFPRKPVSHLLIALPSSPPHEKLFPPNTTAKLTLITTKPTTTYFRLRLIENIFLLKKEIAAKPQTGKVQNRKDAIPESLIKKHMRYICAKGIQEGSQFEDR